MSPRLIFYRFRKYTNSECEKCGKKFFAGINIVIDYYGMKSCKLNGEKHDFVMLKTNPEWGTCKKCGGINKLIDSEVL